MPSTPFFVLNHHHRHRPRRRGTSLPHRSRQHRQRSPVMQPAQSILDLEIEDWRSGNPTAVHSTAQTPGFYDDMSFGNGAQVCLSFSTSFLYECGCIMVSATCIVVAIVLNSSVHCTRYFPHVSPFLRVISMILPFFYSSMTLYGLMLM